MLAWADQLYRNDDPSSIRRARELYKGVLFMHGTDPEIAPNFPRGRTLRSRAGLGFNPILWQYHDNPATRFADQPRASSRFSKSSRD